MTQIPQVWMIISSFHPTIGGAEVQALQLSKTLQKMGWRINVLTRMNLFGYRSLPAKEIIDDVSVIRIFSRGRWKIGVFLYLVGGLWYLFWHGRRGIYHAHGEGTASWIAILAAKLLRGKSLIKLRTGVYYYERQYSNGIAGWQFRLWLHLADRVVVVNHEVKKWLINSLGIHLEKIVFIPNSVDVEMFSPRTVDRKKFYRKQLGLPLEKTIFLYVGRLSYLKGVDVLLTAWGEIPESLRPELLLLLVGDGPEYKNLKKMCKELKILGSVAMLGQKRNISEYYWAADIFVLPSRTEGLSNALIEAMACGLPCIVSAVGGALDLINEGENGFLFDVEYHEQLANQIMRMPHLNTQLPEIQNNARKTILTYVDLDSNVLSLQKVYQGLLNQSEQ